MTTALLFLIITTLFIASFTLLLLWMVWDIIIKIKAKFYDDRQAIKNTDESDESAG